MPNSEEDSELSWFNELIAENALCMIQMFWMVRIYETIDLLKDQCLINVFGFTICNNLKDQLDELTEKITKK